MPLRTDIEQRYIEAMKAKDADKVSTYRMLRAAIKNAEIDKQAQLTDDQAVEVIGKEVKKLRTRWPTSRRPAGPISPRRSRPNSP